MGSIQFSCYLFIYIVVAIDQLEIGNRIFCPDQLGHSLHTILLHFSSSHIMVQQCIFRGYITERVFSLPKNGREWYHVGYISFGKIVIVAMI